MFVICRPFHWLSSTLLALFSRVADMLRTCLLIRHPSATLPPSFRHAFILYQEIWNLYCNCGTYEERTMTRLCEQELKRLIQGGEAPTVELKAAAPRLP